MVADEVASCFRRLIVRLLFHKQTARSTVLPFGRIQTNAFVSGGYAALLTTETGCQVSLVEPHSDVAKGRQKGQDC